MPEHCLIIGDSTARKHLDVPSKGRQIHIFQSANLGNRFEVGFCLWAISWKLLLCEGEKRGGRHHQSERTHNNGISTVFIMKRNRYRNRPSTRQYQKSFLLLYIFLPVCLIDPSQTWILHKPGQIFVPSQGRNAISKKEFTYN